MTMRQPQEFPYDVFLSHSAKDKAVVRVPSLSASNGGRAGVRCRIPLRQDGRQGKAECRRSKAAILHSAFILHPFHCAPLNRERRFIPLRFDDDCLAQTDMR